MAVVAAAATGCKPGMKWVRAQLAVGSCEWCAWVVGAHHPRQQIKSCDAVLRGAKSVQLGPGMNTQSAQGRCEVCNNIVQYAKMKQRIDLRACLRTCLPLPISVLSVPLSLLPVDP